MLTSAERARSEQQRQAALDDLPPTSWDFVMKTVWVRSTLPELVDSPAMQVREAVALARQRDWWMDDDMVYPR